MLEDNAIGYAEQPMAKLTERCKPDYEGMIKRAKEKLGKTVLFKDAALNYFKGKRASGKMAELIGELVTTSNQLQQELDSLIEAQEKDTTGE